MGKNVSVIVSVYKDADALALILFWLNRQTVLPREVLVTEDGDSEEINALLEKGRWEYLSIRHLTQDDDGFRKTRAVNRAIAAASAEYLIFIDGDCIPHPRFIEMHLKDAVEGFFCLGRRLHLGEKWSQRVRRDPYLIQAIVNWSGLIGNFFSLHRDHVRNYELGAPSRLLNSLFGDKKINFVGCNFSIFRKDILKVNGYDEDLVGIGGEDDDLGRRLESVGLVSKNIKFLAPCYHLNHKQRREGWNENQKVSDEKYARGEFFSKKGVSQYVQVQ